MSILNPFVNLWKYELKIYNLRMQMIHWQLTLNFKQIFQNGKKKAQENKFVPERKQIE